MPINSFKSLFTVAEFAKSKFRARAWFRGHRDRDWRLQPSVFRDQSWPIECQDYERTISRLFKARAPLRIDERRLPRDGDWFGWLTLARHYGLDTRLLDWTESFLTAAYFAVESFEKTRKGDAAIWAVDPGAINLRTTRGQTRALVDKDSVLVKATAAPAFGAEVVGHAPRSCLAVVAQEFDLRMLVQRAHFTIHGDNKPLDEALEGIEDKKVSLYCCPIARRFRKSLYDGLRLVGMDRGFLFPDPDSMARAIMEEHALLAKFD